MTATQTTLKSITTRKRSKPDKRFTFNELPVFSGVTVSNDWIMFSFNDGRVVSVPLGWSEKLSNATQQQRDHVTVSDLFAFWDDVDEIIGVENVLYGNQLYK